MRCPKCGYVSFEYLDTCKKCSKDLFEFKEKAGIFLMEPRYLDLNKYAEGLKSESAPSAVETEEMEYEEGEGALDRVSEGPASAAETNFFDSLDMAGERETAGIADREADEAEGVGMSAPLDEVDGHDLTADDGVLGLDAGSDEEIKLSAGEEGIDLLEGSEIEIDEAGSGETAKASTELDGVDLNEDYGLSGLDIGGEEITLDLEEEDGGAGAAEESDIKINMESEELTAEAAGETAGHSPSAESDGEIDFSINLDEDISSDHEEESGDTNDLEGEIDLMLDDLEDGPEKS